MHKIQFAQRTLTIESMLRIYHAKSQIGALNVLSDDMCGVLCHYPHLIIFNVVGAPTSIEILVYIDFPFALYYMYLYIRLEYASYLCNCTPYRHKDTKLAGSSASQAPLLCNMWP